MRAQAQLSSWVYELVLYIIVVIGACDCCQAIKVNICAYLSIDNQRAASLPGWDRRLVTRWLDSADWCFNSSFQIVIQDDPSAAVHGTTCTTCHTTPGHTWQPSLNTSLGRIPPHHKSITQVLERKFNQAVHQQTQLCSQLNINRQWRFLDSWAPLCYLMKHKCYYNWLTD